MAKKKKGKKGKGVKKPKPKPKKVESFSVSGPFYVSQEKVDADL